MNGAASTRMQIGVHAALGDSSSFVPEWPLTTATWAGGTSVIASIWPPSSALTRAVSSGKSMITTWSKYGWPVRQ